MKKSTFWIIVTVISMIFTIHSIMNTDIIQAVIGCATCCASHVISALYERKERKEENH